jgi:hypothetical protein
MMRHAEFLGSIIICICPRTASYSGNSFLNFDLVVEEMICLALHIATFFSSVVGTIKKV